MKLMLVSFLTVLLAGGSVAVANPHFDCEQQTPERPRRVELPARSFLGVELSEVNKDTVSRLKLHEERGAVIDNVTTGSGAAKAGLQKNDVIVKWDGQRIESASEVSRQIHETPPGRSVRLGLMRDGKEIELNVTMGERPSSARRFTVVRPSLASVRVRPERVRPEIIRPEIRGSSRSLGVELQDMTPQLAEYFGLSKRSGALVIFVFADSPAAKAGLKAGDVILSVGAETVQNPVDVRRALNGRPETGEVEFKVLRDKQEKTLKVQLEKGTSSWLLAPDSDDGSYRYAIAPAIPMPKFKLASTAIKVPAVTVKPMKLQVPKWKLAPMAIPQIKLEQMDLEPMILEIPQIELQEMNIEIPHIEFEKMEIQLPELKLDPVKIVVAPRRIVL